MYSVPKTYQPPNVAPPHNEAQWKSTLNDPGKSSSDATWYHNVNKFYDISQFRVSPYGGWWPASPYLASSRGDSFRGYGGYAPLPYNGGYLVYPSNYDPVSTSQLSTTNLYPFCMKQR